jgi:Ca2+-binding RTX toxin-like protein
MNNLLTGLNVMTGNMVSNADEFQASNSQAQIATADNAPSSPCLQNPAARLFKKSPWLNDISLPILLLLAGQIAARPANARQEASLDNIIITAQNQFGTVSQLTIRDRVLYLLEEGCHLVMIRQLGADDISSIRALANLRAEEVGLHLQLISYAPLSDADISEFCVASDPLTAFITRIRQEDSDSSNLAGMLAGGLGLLLGLAGGGGSDILIGEGGMDLFRLDLDDDGTDTVLGFTLGEDKIQIDTAFQDDFTLAELGLEIIESNDGMHAHIVNANDNSHIYMTIENIDHEDLGVTDFEII